MKKLSILSAVIAFAFVAIQGCGKDKIDSDNRNNAKLIINMTDAPGDFQEVNVEILHVDIHYEDDSIGWLRLKTHSGIYNLLELQDSITATLVDEDNLPEGRVSQMRLILGSQNTVMVDSAIYPLKVPSGQQSGLKLNIHKELTADHQSEILFDFDAEKSVVITGNQQYILKPVIKILK